MSSEMHEIFSNLNEAILMVQNSSVTFANHVFEDILKSIKAIPQNLKYAEMGKSILDLKIFKLIRSNE